MAAISSLTVLGNSGSLLFTAGASAVVTVWRVWFVVLSYHTVTPEADRKKLLNFELRPVFLLKIT